MAKLISTATYRPELAGAVREYNTQYAIDSQFIGMRVLPEAVRELAEGTYPVLKKENFRKLVNTGRAPGAGFSRGDWQWDKQAYDCIENAHEIPMDIKEMEKYAAIIDYEEESAIGADYIVRLAYEKRVADAVMDSSVFTPHNVETAWATIASSDPLADIDAATNALSDQLGVPRNMLSIVLPRSGWQYLRNSAAVLDKLKSWNSGIQSRESIRQEVVAEYLDVKEIVVASGSYDSANEGLTQSLTQIWPDRWGMVALLAPGADAPPKTLCLGRTVRWTSNMPDFVTIETYESKDIDSLIVRARQFTDELIVASFAGYLLDLTKAS